MKIVRLLQRSVWAMVLATLGVWTNCAAGRTHWVLVDHHIPDPNNIFFTDGRHGVLTGWWPWRNCAAIVWTRDGGRRWHSAKIPPLAKKASLFGLWFSNPKLGWAGGLIRSGKVWWTGKFILLQTHDGGRAWQIGTAPPGLHTNLSHIWFMPGGKHGRLLPSGGRIFWQTANGGQTWQTVDVGHQFGSAAWIGSWRHIVLGGQRGAVLVSTDAGKTWTKISTGLKGPMAGIAAISFLPGGQVGWAVGGQGKALRNGDWTQAAQPVILHTLNGGKTWTRQTPRRVPTGPFTTVRAISAQQAWVGSYLGYATANPAGAMPWILHTTDGGKTWHNTLRHVVSIHQLFFLNSLHGWALGGQGGSPYEPLAAAVLILRIRHRP